METNDDISLKQRIYLEGIASGMNYSEAAQFADVDRTTGWHWRQDAEFMKLVEKAQEIRVDNLKKEAERRAMRGSDKLLMFLLCNYDPDNFQMAQRVDLNAKVNSRAEVRIVSEFEGDDLV